MCHITWPYVTGFITGVCFSNIDTALFTRQGELPKTPGTYRGKSKCSQCILNSCDSCLFQYYFVPVPIKGFSQDKVAWAVIQCHLGYQRYFHAALPLGLLPRTEYCNRMEKGLEQGQGCATFFISALSESSSAGPTGEMQKPPVLSGQLFGQIRVAAQMNRVPCWVLLYQFSLTRAGRVLQN